MNEVQSTSQCWLLRLPQELLLSTIDQIHLKRDIYNLSRTCRALEDVCLSRMYAHIDLNLLSPRYMVLPAHAVTLLRSHAARVVRRLALRCRDPSAQTYGVSLQRLRAAILALLADIPNDQLESFAVYNYSALPSDIVQLLAFRHPFSLRHLHLYELGDLSKHSGGIPTRLASLECRSIQDNASVSELININASTLRRLQLGFEKELVHRCAQTTVGIGWEPADQSTVALQTVKLHTIPQLHILELYGVDVAALLPAASQDAMFFCRLSRLVIESCTGSSSLLQCLETTFNHARSTTATSSSSYLPHLKEFLFRTEAPTTRLKEALLLFLDSFTGLQVLSLLFENSSMMESIPTLLCEHGPTLQTLVLESRIQSRENLGWDTSRLFGAGGHLQEMWEQSINEMCQRCPNLIELGMGFPWDHEVLRLRKTLLPTLPKLRTIHIRNFPETRSLSQVGDYTVKEYGQKFIDWVFPTFAGGDKPALETLAIGPTVYQSRWGSIGGGQRIPEYKRSHYFCVDWALNRFREWNAMVSPVSELYLEEVRSERPLRGAFEQVWLR